MLGILLAVIFVGGFLLFGFNDNLKQDPKRFGLVVLALVLGVIALLRAPWLSLLLIIGAFFLSRYKLKNQNKDNNDLLDN
jgi:hypothetical protein